MEKKHLVIHLRALSEAQLQELGEVLPGRDEGLDEEWFEIVLEDDMVMLRLRDLEALAKMVVAYRDHVIIDPPL